MDSGTAVFAFRGTESKQDGLQDIKMLRRNIDYLQRAYPGAKAHTGARDSRPLVSKPCTSLGDWKIEADCSPIN